MISPKIELTLEGTDPGDRASWVDLSEKAISAAVRTGNLKFEEDAEVSLLLAGDERLRALNNEWRGKDKPTNVLSFPGSEISPDEKAGLFIGDIAISMETLTEEANLEKKSVNDHFCHLVIHGFLHLFGYDHETDEEAAIMEGLEVRILANLGIGNPYEGFEDQ